MSLFPFSTSKVSFLVFWFAQLVTKSLWCCYLSFSDIECLFSLDTFNSFIIGFQQFNHNILLSGFLYFYSAWDLLKFLGLWVYIFLQIWKSFANNTLNIFLSFFLSSGTLAICMLDCLCCSLGPCGSLFIVQPFKNFLCLSLDSFYCYVFKFIDALCLF